MATIGIGINPIGWSNYDVPELGGRKATEWLQMAGQGSGPARPTP